MSTSEHADYTPTTDDARRYYIEQRMRFGDVESDEQAGDEFDRWIAALASTPSPAQPTEASIQRLDPDVRAELIEFARVRIEQAWADVPSGVDAATLASNVVHAQEFYWMQLAASGLITPSPAQPTEANEREALKIALTDGYWQKTGYRVTWGHIGPLMDAILEAGFRLAPSPVQGALSAEERGIIIDALIEHERTSTARKAANSASNSDERAEMCKALIVRLGSPVQGADDRLAPAEAKLAAVEALAAKAEHGALRWADPLPVPEWVERVRAIIQQSPQAALNEVRAGARREAIEEAAQVVLDSRQQLEDELGRTTLTPDELVDGREAINMLSRIAGAIGHLHKANPPFARAAELRGGVQACNDLAPNYLEHLFGPVHCEKDPGHLDHHQGGNLAWPNLNDTTGAADGS